MIRIAVVAGAMIAGTLAINLGRMQFSKVNAVIVAPAPQPGFVPKDSRLECYRVYRNGAIAISCG